MDRAKFIASLALFVWVVMVGETATAKHKYLWGGFVIVENGKIDAVFQNNKKKVKLECNKKRTHCTGVIYEMKILIRFKKFRFGDGVLSPHKVLHFNEDRINQSKCSRPKFVQEYVNKLKGKVEIYGFADACW